MTHRQAPQDVLIVTQACLLKKSEIIKKSYPSSCSDAYRGNTCMAELILNL